MSSCKTLTWGLLAVLMAMNGTARVALGLDVSEDFDGSWTGNVGGSYPVYKSNESNVWLVSEYGEAVRVGGEGTNGTYAARFTTLAGSRSSGDLVLHPQFWGAQYKDVYLRFYLRRSSNYQWWRPCGLQKLAYLGPGDTKPWRMMLGSKNYGTDGGNVGQLGFDDIHHACYPYDTVNECDVGEVAEDVAKPISNNQWYCVEWNVSLGDNGAGGGDDRVRLWVDDDLSMDRPNMSNPGGNGSSINYLYMNMYHGGGDNCPTSSVTMYTYIDDLVVSDSRIGCGAAPASPSAPTGVQLIID